MNRIDFSEVPKEANYFLNGDLSAGTTAPPGIFEIPIASSKIGQADNSMSKIKIFLTFFRNKVTPEKFGNGHEKPRGYIIQEQDGRSQYSNYYQFIKSFPNRFSYLDCSTDAENMFTCTKNYVQQFDLNQDIYFSFNMHPKGMTERHLQALERYHKKIQRYYHDTIQPISFQQAADLVFRTDGVQ